MGGATVPANAEMPGLASIVMEATKNGGSCLPFQKCVCVCVFCEISRDGPPLSSRKMKTL